MKNLLKYFSIVLVLISCSDSSSPSDPQDQTKKFTSAKLYCEITVESKTYTLKAEGIGTTLGNNRGVYFLEVLWNDGSSDTIEIKNGFTMAFSNPNILSFEESYAEGLAVGETDITLTYPKEGNYEGFTYETKGWTYQYSVTGTWKIYELINETWEYLHFDVKLHDIPEKKSFGTDPDYPSYFYDSVNSNTYTNGQNLIGEIKDQNTIFENFTSGSKYFKYERIH